MMRPKGSERWAPYADAAETDKPGYLARKFRAIAKRQQEEAAAMARTDAAALSNVTPITKETTK